MSKIQRRQDWRTRLLEWSTEQVGCAFMWGDTDCASLARTALAQMFGKDVTDLPAWGTAREALTVLKEHGSVEDVMMRLGAQKHTVAFMRAGDILVVEEPSEDVGRVAVMVCVDGRRCLYSSRAGVGMTELPADTKASVFSLWEVATHG